MSSNHEQQTEPKSFLKNLPDLFWAAAILAGVNVLLLVWFSISPSFALGLDKAPRVVRAAEDALASRPSPFTPVVDESPQLARRVAAKVRPMAVAAIDESEQFGEDVPQGGSEPPIGADVMKTVYQHEASDPAARPLNTAAGSRTSNNYYRGDDVYRIMDHTNDMPRVTASNLPSRRIPVQRVDELLAR